MSLNEAREDRRVYGAILRWLVTLFSFYGKLGQAAFLTNLYVILSASVVSLFFGDAPVIQTLLSLAAIVSLTSSVLRRLTDAGLNRWFALLALLPVVGWIVAAILVSLPTKAFGAQGLRLEVPKALLLLVSMITILVVLAAPIVAGARAGVRSPAAPVAEGTPEPVPVAPSPSTTATATATPTVVPTIAPTAAAASYAALIALLPVAEEAPSGYDRDLFRLWTDANGNGCDTRDEVLIGESLTPVSVGSGCSLSGGSWFSVYDSVSTTDSSSFDVDHFVPLKEAWDSGANRWDASTREAYANDLGYDGSLIAVSASSNRSKSDRDPAAWMPDVSAYDCQYIYTWIEVKLRWGLTVDGAEQAALTQGSIGCDLGSLGYQAEAARATVQQAP